MPSSLLAQWPFILSAANLVAPKTVLDVGPGWGKGAVLLREYVPSVTKIDAVEAHGPYIMEHGLGALYRAVHRSRFEEMTVEQLAGYDLVLMVDVIEHIEDGVAMHVLQRVAKHLLVCTPDVFEVSWVPGLPETERHVSVWTPEMVENCGFDCLHLDREFAGWVGLFKREDG